MSGSPIGFMVGYFDRLDTYVCMYVYVCMYECMNVL